MGLFNDEVKQQLTDILKEVKDEVHFAFFGKEEGCKSCEETKNFVTEFASLNDKVSVEVFDVDKDADKAKEYNVDKVPAIVVLDKDKKDYGVKFYGIPAGYEINSLIATVMNFSGNREEFSPEIMKRIKAIDKKVHIKVFVTPTCPYCPKPVITGHRLALENGNVIAEMVEATSFPAESQKYAVRGVPKIVINENHHFVGAQPIEKFLEVIDSLN